MKTFHIKLAPIIGIGYWKDVYEVIPGGYTHNIILPFVRIQFGYLPTLKELNHEA